MKKNIYALLTAFAFLLLMPTAKAGCPPKYTTTDTVICSGRYIIVNGHNYNTTGTYYDTITMSCGNKNYIRTNLTIGNPTIAVTVNYTICQGQQITVNGHNYDTSGTYIDTIPRISCGDSIQTTHLVVNAKPGITIARNNYVNVAQTFYSTLLGAFTNSTYDNDNQAKYAFDGDTTYYGWAGTGNYPDGPTYLGYTYATPVALNTYGLYLSCDQLGGWCSVFNTPFDWTFQGSNGTNWVTLDSVTNANVLIGARSDFNFTNTTAYKSYRINITATNSSGSGFISPHITEFFLTGADSLTAPSNITASDFYEETLPEFAFDNDTVFNGWASYGDSLPAWLAYDFKTGNQTVVNAYSFYNSCAQKGGWCNDGYNATSWRFEATNNDTTWTTLDTVANAHLLIGVKSIFPISNTAAFRKYRVYFTNSDFGNIVRVTEIELLQKTSNCGSGNYIASVTNITDAASISGLQWKVNGNNIGSGWFTQNLTDSLHKGDLVTCELIADNNCLVPVTVTSNALLYSANTSDTTSLTVCKDSLVFNGTPVSQSGTYSNTVVTAFGCDSSYTYILTVNNCATGIDELNGAWFNLLPNPNKGYFTLQFSTLAEHNIQITDMLGSQITNLQYSGAQTQIDLGNQPSGVYFVTVTQNGHKKQLRFIIEK